MTGFLFYSVVYIKPFTRLVGYHLILYFCLQLNSDGEFTHQFTKKDLIQHINSTTSYRYSQIRLDGQAFKVMANVTENNSMRQQKGKGEITFYDSPLKMDFMDISPSNFKPGLPYTGYVSLYFSVNFEIL